MFKIEGRHIRRWIAVILYLGLIIPFMFLANIKANSKVDEQIIQIVNDNNSVIQIINEDNNNIEIVNEDNNEIDIIGEDNNTISGGYDYPISHIITIEGDTIFTTHYKELDNEVDSLGWTMKCFEIYNLEKNEIEKICTQNYIVEGLNENE